MIVLEVVWKVSDETHNLQKPNPPFPPSLQGNGVFKASPLPGERFGEGSVSTLKTFKTSSYIFLNAVLSELWFNLSAIFF